MRTIVNNPGRGRTVPPFSRAGPRRYGAPALLLSWVPLIGDVLVVLAGAARMRVVPFVTWTTIGKAARYLALAAAVGAFASR